jgi:hypothetical protein
MNLNVSPVPSDLQSLLAACNDNSAHHILWVNITGDVFISPLPNNLAPTGFEDLQPDMRLRYESFQCGAGYTGVLASRDLKYVQRIYDSLVKEWQLASISNVSGVEYIDQF